MHLRLAISMNPENPRTGALGQGQAHGSGPGQGAPWPQICRPDSDAGKVGSIGQPGGFMRLRKTSIRSWATVLGLFPSALASAAQGEAMPQNLPIGVSAALYEVSVPPGKIPTPQQVALGEKLFHEKHLSATNTVSCATCHDPKLGFVDGKALSNGISLRHTTQRNSPTVLNAMFHASQFWDGRAKDLEDQAKLPIVNPIEMGLKSGDDAVAKLKAIPAYVTAFRQAFGRDITYDDVATAIAAFERMQFSGEASFDRFVMGRTRAISESARRGWVLFNGKARCLGCHGADATNPLFSDQKFHNIGVAANKQAFDELAAEALQVVRTGDQKQVDELAIQTKFSELGRFLVTKQENDIGAFKTPSLRNVGITAPYMHDGSLATLWDVVDHYNKGGEPNRFLDGGMQRLGLEEREIDDLVAFLFSLTDQRYARLALAEQSRQRARKRKRPERDTDVAMGKRGHMGDLAPNPDLKNPADLGFFGRYPQTGAAPLRGTNAPEVSR